MINPENLDITDRDSGITLLKTQIQKKPLFRKSLLTEMKVISRLKKNALF